MVKPAELIDELAVLGRALEKIDPMHHAASTAPNVDQASLTAHAALSKKLLGEISSVSSKASDQGNASEGTGVVTYELYYDPTSTEQYTQFTELSKLEQRISRLEKAIYSSSSPEPIVCSPLMSASLTLTGNQCSNYVK